MGDIKKEDEGNNLGEKKVEEKLLDPQKKKSKPQRNFPQYNIVDSLKVARTIADNNAGNPWDCE